MLQTDVAKLRWMGLDMRSRGRRRVAVILTYAAYAVVIWLHLPGTSEATWAMYLTCMAGLVTSRAVADGAMNACSKRAISGGVFVSCVWLAWKHPMRPNRIDDDMWSFVMIVFWSVLGWGKLVQLEWRENWFTRRFSMRKKRLVSLDDVARHHFGDSFAELNEENQMKVGSLHRASPMGEWVKPGSERFPRVEDERLRHEDDRLRAQVQRWMNWILGVSAVVWSVGEGLRLPVSVETMAAWAWTVATLAVTLRPAIVLWTEVVVVDASVEMELVEREA